MERLKKISGLYVILDSSILGKRPLVPVARQVLAGGATVLQLRDKTADSRTLLRKAKALLKLTRPKHALLIINDRVDITVASGADGVHLGETDLTIAQARRMLGHGKIIGATSHDLAEAKANARAGADYVSLGAIFKSSIKPHLKPTGLALLGRVCRAVRKPIVAIGGIHAGNIQGVMEAGAASAAVISAVLKAGNVKKAVQSLVSRVRTT